MENDLTLIVNLEATSSRTVADVVGMRHADVLRSIMQMGSNLADAEKRLLWCKGIYYDGQNKPRKEYVLTKKGLLFLMSKYDDRLRLMIINRVEYLEEENRRLEDERSKRMQLELSHFWNKSDINDLYN